MHSVIDYVSKIPDYLLIPFYCIKHHLTNQSFFAVSGLNFSGPIEPLSVQNGSSLGVILDCPYELEQDDTHGLVIKWFFSGNPRPVYQWIPGNNPQDFEKLSGRLDLSYVASNEEFKQYRALSILNPTTELTGMYSCYVSNFEDEAHLDVRLTVYNPPSEFYITYDNKNEMGVRVNCIAEEVFPQPKLALFRMVPTSGTYQVEEAETVAEEEQDDDDTVSYTISLERDFKPSELLKKNDFLCSLTIPDTEYQIDRDITYFPETYGFDISDAGASNLLKSSFVLVFGVLILLLL